MSLATGGKLGVVSRATMLIVSVSCPDLPVGGSEGAEGDDWLDLEASADGSESPQVRPVMAPSFNLHPHPCANGRLDRP
jgi:hypothetical protein